MPVKFVPMKNSRLCSKHFSADMFEKGYSQRPVLKPYAVPTIFNDCFGQVGCHIYSFKGSGHYLWWGVAAKRKWLGKQNFE